MKPDLQKIALHHVAKIGKKETSTSFYIII